MRCAAAEAVCLGPSEWACGPSRRGLSTSPHRSRPGSRRSQGTSRCRSRADRRAGGRPAGGGEGPSAWASADEQDGTQAKSRRFAALGCRQDADAGWSAHDVRGEVKLPDRRRLPRFEVGVGGVVPVAVSTASRPCGSSPTCRQGSMCSPTAAGDPEQRRDERRRLLSYCIAASLSGPPRRPSTTRPAAARKSETAQAASAAAVGSAPALAAVLAGVRRGDRRLPPDPEPLHLGQAEPVGATITIGTCRSGAGQVPGRAGGGRPAGRAAGAGLPGVVPAALQPWQGQVRARPAPC